MYFVEFGAAFRLCEAQLTFFHFFRTVEKYDPQADEWSTVSSMFLRRTSVGAAVLECFNLERGLVQTTNL